MLHHFCRNPLRHDIQHIAALPLAAWAFTLLAPLWHSWFYGCRLPPHLPGEAVGPSAPPGAALRMLKTSPSWQGQAAPEAIGSGASILHILPLIWSPFLGHLWQLASHFPYFNDTTQTQNPVLSMLSSYSTLRPDMALFSFYPSCTAA